MGSKWMYLFLATGLVWYHEASAHKSPFTILHEWSQLEFDYPSEEARQDAIDSGEFNAGYIPPIDVDVYHNARKVFITVPRFGSGRPASLGIVTNRELNGNPIIAPYPSWEWHQNLDLCAQNRIVSVVRISIDECDRLWVFDTGRFGGKRICPAQILAFDLETDEVIHRYEIPESHLQSNSLPLTTVVDVRDPPPLGKCEDTFVYAGDCVTMSIIVHDVQRNTSWYVIDKTMYPFPTFGTYNIAGEHFDVMDGILGMALSPYRPGEDRILFYHALSSGTENWIHTSHLRNQSLFGSSAKPAPELFHTYSGHRHTQAAAQAIDRKGIAYFGLASDISINCWNTAMTYGDRNIGVLDQNYTTLQFASGLKVIDDEKGTQELWFITIRFQKIATGTLDPTEINFRIHYGQLENIIGPSNCLRGHHGHDDGISFLDD